MKVLLCAIAKNENNYINEWIDHYRSIGIDHILLFDNNDIDGETFDEVISDDINSGFVEIKNVRGKSRQQIPCYDKCYRDYSSKFDWICYFDLDEFLDLDCKNIHSFLENEKYDKFECIVLSWKTFDDSNIIKINNNYSISRFNSYIKEDIKMTKRFYRTNIPGIIMNSAHGAIDKDGQNHNLYHSCNTLGNEVEPQIMIKNGTWEIARLNHYRYKTLEEFVTNKMKRGYATWWLNDGKDLGLKQFFEINKLTYEKVLYIIHKFGISFEQAEQLIGKSLQAYKKKYYDNSYSIYYWKDRVNVGDVFGKWLIENFEINTKWVPNNPDLALCGSILQSQVLGKNTRVIGCGLHNAYDKPAIPKNNIFGIRGKLSYKQSSIDKPISIGDSGLLLSYFYKPKPTHKYKYGIVCHWRDQKFFEEKYKNTNVHIISTATSDIEFFADELAECDFIFSSSLHGIIFAHSLGIPAVHLERIELESKDNFKFKDYYSVTSLKYTKIVYNKELNFDNFLANIDEDNYKIPRLELTRIQNSILCGLDKLVKSLSNKSIIINKRPQIIKEKGKIDVVIHFVNKKCDSSYEYYCKSQKKSLNINRQSFSEDDLNKTVKTVKSLSGVKNIYLIIPSMTHCPKNSSYFKEIYTYEELCDIDSTYNNSIIDLYIDNIKDLSEKFIYITPNNILTKFNSTDDFFLNNVPKLFLTNNKNLYIENVINKRFNISDNEYRYNSGYGLTKSLMNLVKQEISTEISMSKTPIETLKTLDKSIFYYYIKFAKLYDLKI